MIEIRLEDHKIRQFERMLAGIPNALPRVMSRGLNRTATEARTQASRRLSQATGLRVKDIRPRIVLKRATYKNWRSAIEFRAGGMPVVRFPHEPTTEGVTYRPSRRKHVLIRHAFRATMPSGHTGVFLRARYAKGRYIPMKSRPKREAIYEQKVRLQDVFLESQAEMNRVYIESLARLEKNIHDQVQLILRRRAG